MQKQINEKVTIICKNRISLKTETAFLMEKSAQCKLIKVQAQSLLLLCMQFMYINWTKVFKKKLQNLKNSIFSQSENLLCFFKVSVLTHCYANFCVHCQASSSTSCLMLSKKEISCFSIRRCCSS